MIKIIGGSDITDREETTQKAPDQVENIPNGNNEAIFQEMESQLVGGMKMAFRINMQPAKTQAQVLKELENRQKL